MEPNSEIHGMLHRHLSSVPSIGAVCGLYCSICLCFHFMCGIDLMESEYIYFLSLHLCPLKFHRIFNEKYNFSHRYHKQPKSGFAVRFWCVSETPSGDTVTAMLSLQWHHNGHDSISNHQPHECLLNGLFRRRSKKTSKLRVTGLCAGNSPGTAEFPAQMASYAENVSI